MSCFLFSAPCGGVAAGSRQWGEQQALHFKLNHASTWSFAPETPLPPPKSLFRTFFFVKKKSLRPPPLHYVLLKIQHSIFLLFCHCCRHTPFINMEDESISTLSIDTCIATALSNAAFEVQQQQIPASSSTACFTSQYLPKELTYLHVHEVQPPAGDGTYTLVDVFRTVNRLQPRTSHTEDAKRKNKEQHKEWRRQLCADGAFILFPDYLVEFLLLFWPPKSEQEKEELLRRVKAWNKVSFHTLCLVETCFFSYPVLLSSSFFIVHTLCLVETCFFSYPVLLSSSFFIVHASLLFLLSCCFAWTLMETWWLMNASRVFSLGMWSKQYPLHGGNHVNWSMSKQ